MAGAPPEREDAHAVANELDGHVEGRGGLEVAAQLQLVRVVRGALRGSVGADAVRVQQSASVEGEA